jgi:hypothetical protein
MHDFFALQKQKITAFLLPFLEKKRKDLKRTGDMGGGVCARLKTFVPRGKMLRGGPRLSWCRPGCLFTMISWTAIWSGAGKKACFMNTLHGPKPGS